MDELDIIGVDFSKLSPLNEENNSMGKPVGNSFNEPGVWTSKLPLNEGLDRPHSKYDSGFTDWITDIQRLLPGDMILQEAYELYKRKLSHEQQCETCKENNI